MSAPPPPSHDPQIERILLQTVPWDARQKGGSLLQDCLRDLWEKAVNIGFNYGEENLARVREEGYCEGKIAGFTEGVESERSKTALEYTKTAALCEKALEAERVWGYDVGWKLCSELQTGVQKTSTTLSSPPARSTSAVAVQTEPCSMSVAAVQTEPTIVPKAPLDWAEDAADLPTISPRSPSSTPTPRDFSALSTGTTKPFASLQRRRHRPRAPSSWSPSHSIRCQRTNYRHSQKNTPHSHSSFRFTAPSNSFPPGPMPTQLDWERDPRLRDLSRALTALGWVKL